MAVLIQRKVILVTLTLVWMLYAVACVVPAIHLPTGAFIGHGSPAGPVAGWALVYPGGLIVLGMFNPTLAPLAWAWLANPLLVLGSLLLVCRKVRSAMAAAIVGLVLSMGCLMPSDDVDGLLVGYYLWLASMVGLAIGAWLSRSGTFGSITRRLTSCEP
jgi:hypothetical protein